MDDRIFFSSDRGGNYEVWSIRADGSDLRPVTAAGHTASDPVWSPDGGRIAYNLWVGDRVSTYLIDANVAWDEQIPEELPELEDNDATFMMAPVSLGFSPDGDFLSGHHSETRASILYVVAEKRYITDPPRPLYWVPNGRGRYVSRGDDGLFVHDPRTGSNEPLDGPDLVRPFGEVSPDGRWVYYFVTDVSADLFMFTLR